MKIDEQTFIVFDLDDTLYKEDDYHTSGLNAVALLVLMTHGLDLKSDLIAWKQSGNSDIWATLCNRLGLCEASKSAFVWAYRLHTPKICLSKETRHTIDLLEKMKVGFAILTDGRSISQRLKLAALGLNTCTSYISEEWASEKPDPRRFIEIQKRHRAEQFLYIADNPKKDFVAPNRLGWLTVGLRGDSRNVHSQDTTSLATDYLPAMWLDSISELGELIC